jgi:hypothetical protein
MQEPITYNVLQVTRLLGPSNVWLRASFDFVS